MRVSSFEDDIKKQQIPAHLRINKQFMSDKEEIPIENFKDLKYDYGKEISHIDRTLYWKSLLNVPHHLLLECKSDYKAIHTGNIVIELATGMQIGRASCRERV